MIILLPPRDRVCTIVNSTSEENISSADDVFSRRNDLIAIPLKPFEISHLNSYHPTFIKEYAKAHVFFDLEVAVAQQAQREVSYSLTFFLKMVRAVEMKSYCSQLSIKGWAAMKI